MLCEVRVTVSSFRLSMEVEVGWGVSQARLDLGRPGWARPEILELTYCHCRVIKTIKHQS